MPIHPTAIIDPSSEIDPTASVGPYALIGPRVQVGPEVEIMGHAYIDKDTVIGRGSRVFPFSTVGADPQDLKYKGESTRLVVGERVTIREGCSLHRGTAGGGGITEIGDDTLIMATVHVAHDCRLGSGVILSSYVVLAGHVTIGQGAIIGGHSAIHQFCRIGAHAFLGGGSIATKDVPPYMAAANGRSSRDLVLAGPNVVGLKRKQVPLATIKMLKEVFAVVCRNHRPLAEVLAEAESLYGSCPEARIFLDFFPGSERGVYR